MPLKSGASLAPQLTFSLRSATVRIELPIHLPASTVSALEQQIARRCDSAAEPWSDFSRALREAVHRVLDDDLKEPNDGQLREAARLARARGVDLPNEAISYRGALRQFIARITAANESDSPPTIP